MPNCQFVHYLPTIDHWVMNMKKLGLSMNDNIVLYDSMGIAGVSRAWFMMQVFGHPNALILKGGLPKYEKEGLPIENGPITSKPSVVKVLVIKTSTDSFEYKYQKRIVITHEEVQNYSYQLKKGYIDNVEIIDARPIQRFNSEVKEPRPGVRSGNIPMSKSFYFEKILENDFDFKDQDGIREAFKFNNVDLNKFIISSCGSGVTASVLFLAQRIIGNTNNAVYDGSWVEYGSLPEYKDEEVEKRISEPMSNKFIPKLVTLEESKNYFWCSCGKSSDIVFCDGSHRSTKFKPLKFKSPTSVNKSKLLCRCKNTKNKPFCDGSHLKVSINYLTGQKLFKDITSNTC